MSVMYYNIDERRGEAELGITIGDRRARYMLMTNRRIPAYQALEWGLVNDVAPSIKKDGEFISHATPEQIAKAQKGADGYSIDLSKLLEKNSFAFHYR